MLRAKVARLRALVFLAPMLLLGACAPTSGEAPQPPALPAPPPSTPGDTGSGGDTFDVTITARGIEFLVDDLEIEFNRIRGIKQVYGFYPDRYETMAKIPFRDLLRIDFLGMMPPVLFDQAMVGRENLEIRADTAFELRLTYRDNRQEQYYGLVPKFRGERDFQVWTLGMAHNGPGIDYIEFNR